MSIITSVAIIWLFMSIVLILLFFWSGVRKARPMFTDDHYRELLALAQKLKPAAIERVGRKLELPGDPRMEITGVGIVIWLLPPEEGSCTWWPEAWDSSHIWSAWPIPHLGSFTGPSFSGSGSKMASLALLP